MTNPDLVLVQPIEPYMEGSEHKNARSLPYRVPRWQAEELKALRFATIVEEPKPASADPKPVGKPPAPVEEPEVERPDDGSDASAGGARAPIAAAQGGPLSSVPAKPGDQPVTPTAPVAKPRRGRPAAKRA